MFKFIFKILKRIIFYIFLLYSFNLFVSPIGIIIPINYITVSFLVLFGIPSLFCLILLSVLLL